MVLNTWQQTHCFTCTETTAQQFFIVCCFSKVSSGFTSNKIVIMIKMFNLKRVHFSKDFQRTFPSILHHCPSTLSWVYLTTFRHLVGLFRPVYPSVLCSLPFFRVFASCGVCSQGACVTPKWDRNRSATSTTPSISLQHLSTYRGHILLQS